MTASALVKHSDLKRMANIAKREGGTIWIEIDGKRIGVSPDFATMQTVKAIAPPIEIDL